jgi:hypothetical protein
VWSARGPKDWGEVHGASGPLFIEHSEVLAGSSELKVNVASHWFTVPGRP